MLTRSKSAATVVQLAWLALAATAFGVIPITVTDLKGRSIEIELVSLSGDSVTFCRAGNAKEYTLPISHFEANSQGLIRKQADLLPPPAPKVEADVTIGKRRSKGDSYYMVNQKITCSVRIANLDTKNSVPSVTGQIVFIGQNRKTPDVYIVLSNQTFEASIERAGNVTKEMKSFTTKYDSDNKGYGNIGGFQYFGYILALKDKDGKIFYDQSSAGSLRQTLEGRRHLLEDVLAYKTGRVLTDKLEPSKSGTTIYRDLD